MQTRDYKKEPVKVVTLFSGYDSQCMALDRIKENHSDFDYELMKWCEIDKYAIAAHNLVYPQWADRNLGDITKVDWKKAHEEIGDIDLLTYSSPCFIAGTLVLTKEGFKPIESLVEGDMVMTHKKRYGEVIEPMARPFKGTIYSFNAMAFHNLECTPEHPFFVRKRYKKWNNPLRRWERKFTQPEWVAANELTKDHYLGYAVNAESNLPQWNGVTLHYGGRNSFVVNTLTEKFTNPSFWYLMGRYVGDGWLNGDTVIICCDSKEADELENKIKEAGFDIGAKCKERTVIKFHITSKELSAFLKRYGQYAHGKHIDGETLDIPSEYVGAFVEGYVASDGTYTENVFKVTTVSRELAYGIGALVAKAYKCPFRIYIVNRPSKCVIEGREVNQRDTYQVVWHTDIRKQDKAFYEEGYVWFPIKSISTEEREAMVYNCEVECDHSYTANGAIVHNCQDFSNAGLQRGGTKGSGTRSSLLWECEKAIITLKPKYLMLENVKALVSKKFFPTFMGWVNNLKEDGYVSFWKVLNAKDYGVPQNRERVFLISIREDVLNGAYQFPQPMELVNRLRDVLEETVEEKYYLSEKSVEGFRMHNENHEEKGTGFK